MMNKKINLTLATMAVACFTGTAAYAAPAVVINPAGGCSLFDGNGGIAVTTDTQSVSTQSANQNTMVKCQATVTPPSYGQAAQFDAVSTNLSCGIVSPLPPFIIATNDWKETVSASGQATLICRYKAP
jgi:hypothetical protein